MLCGFLLFGTLAGGVGGVGEGMLGMGWGSGGDGMGYGWGGGRGWLWGGGGAGEVGRRCGKKEADGDRWLEWK